ncbi:acetylcholinesterase-1 [Caerostris darwini]|uniref:Carboxylic ester hydrolase n=1 Tax=Caerostris darwini TaxID=1538125 RepID=A0AAV4RUD9_9ARAC|nr:acetylcholinesterase-1 [Caerostris darwini]
MLRIFLLVCGLAYGRGCQDNPLIKNAPKVTTHSGSLIGKYVKVFGVDIAAFLGVPYAKPPLGARRFMPPEPVEPWHDSLSVEHKPAPCMQYSTSNYSFMPVTKPTEDCLFLNVWTPVKTCGEPLPVMVWIHGGAFAFGSSDLDVYDGSVLASYGDAVVVSMNYRLGIFGFIDAGTKDAPGNVGLHDQSLAMRWIKDNVHHFGGDPDRITLFGESAGSISVSLHLISPVSKGLFKRAILESGTAYHTGFMDGPPLAHIKANAVAGIVGCSNETITLDSDPSSVLGCLRSVDAMTLAKAEGSITAKTLFWFGPTYPNKFLPKPSIEVYESGSITPADVLMGVVKDEGSLFLHILMSNLFPLDQQPNITLSQVKPLLAGLFKLATAEHKEKLYNFYFRDLQEEDHEDIVKALSNAWGDYSFNCPTMYLAEKLENVHLYQMTHRSQRDPNAEWVGVPHFYEVPFVFGVPIMDSIHYSPEDGRFSEDLLQKWISFARSGSPIEDQDSWPRFSAASSATYELNPKNSHKKDFPYKAACDFFRSS